MQFRKYNIVLLCFLFLISNSGLAINVHYCGNKIASISSSFSNKESCKVPTKKEDSCCKKKKTTQKKCCSDKKINLKNKSEKIVIKTFSFDVDLVSFSKEWNTICLTPVRFIDDSQSIAHYYNPNAPPLYQLYCQYTLFG